MIGDAERLHARPLVPVAGPRRGLWWGATRLGSLLRDASFLLAGLLAVAAWDVTGSDLDISRWFGNAGGFAWRDHWFVAGVLHANAKWLAWLVGVLLLVNVWRPFPFARDVPKGRRVWWAATTLACAALIPLLKLVRLTSCPWSLAEIGGSARYISHWAFGEAGGGAGGVASRPVTRPRRSASSRATSSRCATAHPSRRGAGYS